MTGTYPFVRRQNHDASIDSICSRCYQTIVSTNTVSDHMSAEHDHVCDPSGAFNFTNRERSQRAA